MYELTEGVDERPPCLQPRTGLNMRLGTLDSRVANATPPSPRAHRTIKAPAKNLGGKWSALMRYALNLGPVLKFRLTKHASRRTRAIMHKGLATGATIFQLITDLVTNHSDKALLVCYPMWNIGYRNWRLDSYPTSRYTVSSRSDDPREVNQGFV